MKEGERERWGKEKERKRERMGSESHVDFLSCVLVAKTNISVNNAEGKNK